MRVSSRTFFSMMVVFAGLATAGCIERTAVMEAETAYGKSSVEHRADPLSSSVKIKDEPRSDYETCMARLRGYEHAKATCDAAMVRWSPWQPPQWGQGYGGGLAPSYYAGQYGRTWYGVPYSQ